jgi:hypothetical protein
MTQDVEVIAKTGGAAAVLLLGLHLIGKAFDSITGREKPDQNEYHQIAKAIMELAHSVTTNNQLMVASNQRLSEVIAEMRRELVDHRTILTRLEARERK